MTDDPTLLLISLLLAPLVAGYAEIHFRPHGIPSRLFKKEPEIVFDLPHRCQAGENVPLFLFIKDADRYPVELLEIEVRVAAGRRNVPIKTWQTPVNQSVKTPFFSHIFWLPATLFTAEGNAVTADLRYRLGQKTRLMQQDNYATLPHEPFRIYIAETPLPSLPGWHWGDLHIHSNYTDNPVEFGAPIRHTAICARAVGLHFMAITDHSYDLDNCPGDAQKHDPQLRKWAAFQTECAVLNRELSPFVIIPGEEVSVGNSRGENVHCLVLNSRDFHPGSGDSGERVWQNHPTLNLPTLFEFAKIDPEALIVAAHPFDQSSLPIRLLLNRGHWHLPDLTHPQLDYWQIFNGRTDQFFKSGLAQWKQMLLQGVQVGILAGTDAHGNFNCFRQISIPFLKMIYHRQQLLGQTRTGVYCPDGVTRPALMQQLHRKRAVISDGPIGVMEAYRIHRKFLLGDTLPPRAMFQLRILAKSSPEFGPLTAIRLIIGNFLTRRETVQTLAPGDHAFAFDQLLEFPEGVMAGYLRLEVTAGNAPEPAFCLTNPIWVGSESQRTTAALPPSRK